MNEHDRRNSSKSAGLNTNSTNYNIPVSNYENKFLPESLLKDIYNDEEPLSDKTSDDGCEDRTGKLCDSSSTVPSQMTNLSSNNLSPSHLVFGQFANMGISNTNFSPEIRMRKINLIPLKIKPFSDNNLQGKGRRDFHNLNYYGRPRFDSNFSINSSESNFGSSYSGNVQGGLNYGNTLNSSNLSNFNTQCMMSNRNGFNQNFRTNSNFNQNFFNFEDEQKINGINTGSLTAQNFFTQPEQLGQLFQGDDNINSSNLKENFFIKNGKNNFYASTNNTNNFHNESLRNKKRFSFDSVKNPYKPIQLHMISSPTNNFQSSNTCNSGSSLNLFNNVVVNTCNNISLGNLQMKMPSNIGCNVNIANSSNFLNSMNHSPQRKTNLNKNLNLINLQQNNLSQQQHLLPASTNQVKLPRKNYSEGVNQNLVSNIISDNFNEDSEEEFDTFIEKIGNNLIPFIKTQKGSRYMQKFLNKLQPEKISKLLFGLSKDLKEVMIDNYGNYFMQKLTQCCSSNQRMFVLQSIHQDFLEVACNTSGTHSIQSLIEIINLPEEEDILRNCVEKHILRLSCNSNGTHIIQKIITCFPENHREYLNDYVLVHLGKICMNANGICVVKKFINANKSSEIRERLMRSFEHNCTEIVEDAFGNYAVQYALDNYGYQVCWNLIEHVIKNLLSLSNQKFSSNVVEKCIQVSDRELFGKIISEMFINTTNFVVILKNKYGNFVIQKAIMRINANDRLELKEYLNKNVNINGGKERSKFNAILELLSG